MLDAGGLAHGQVLRARACVVGAGPAGLALARALGDAGVDVLLLEAAGADAPTGPLETTRSAGLAYRVSTTRRRGTGGSSRAWNIATPLGRPYVRLRELDDLDLVARPGLRDVGWPLSGHHLSGAYRDAWAVFGLPPAPDEPDRPCGPGGDGRRKTFAFGAAATFTTRLPQALAGHARVRVLTGAVVTEVRTDRDAGTVSSLRCTGRTGVRFTVEADVHVLAGGGIENARLLLASRSRSPEGVGGASGHLGRYFMEHPHHASAVVRPRDHRLEDDPGTWDVHVDGGVAVQRMFALTREAVEREGVLSAAYYLGPRKVSSLVLTARGGGLHPARTVAVHQWREALRRRALPPGARSTARDVVLALPQAARYAGAQALAERAVRRGHPHAAAPRVMTLRAMAEQVPNPRSRVRLLDERDAFGVPVAELDWQLTDVDWASMARSQQLLLPTLRAALGARVDSVLDAVPRPHVVGGAHHMGTTRMAASPRDGVVDPDGLVHGLRNLYVTGSSVFPTSGSANPTLTVVALALRLAAHLRERLGPLAVRGGAAPGL